MSSVNVGIHAKFLKPPQGNATIERFMRELGKALKTAKQTEGRPRKPDLNRFLLEYHTHCTTLYHNSTAIRTLVHRTVKEKIPLITKKKIVHLNKKAQENGKTRKKQNKEYADHRKNGKRSDIQIGDYVLIH